MPFAKVKVSSLVTKQIQSWALPDRTQVELYQFLTRILPADPEYNLQREADGLVAECVRRDTSVKDRDHYFRFRVLFGQDEETLLIFRGDYLIIQHD